jgi:hypothetical protein
MGAKFTFCDLCGSSGATFRIVALRLNRASRIPGTSVFEEDVVPEPGFEPGPPDGERMHDPISYACNTQRLARSS